MGIFLPRDRLCDHRWRFSFDVYGGISNDEALDDVAVRGLGWGGISFNTEMLGIDGKSGMKSHLGRDENHPNIKDATKTTPMSIVNFWSGHCLPA